MSGNPLTSDIRFPSFLACEVLNFKLCPHPATQRFSNEFVNVTLQKKVTVCGDTYMKLYNCHCCKLL